MYTDPPKEPSLGFAISDLGLIDNLTWSRVDSDCLAVHYNILASACTSISIDNSTCILTVSTIACGNTTGNASDIDDAQGGFKGIN